MGYLLAFGAGVTIAMTLFASVTAMAIRRASDRSIAVGRRVSVLIGGAGVLTGIWWLWSALGS